LTVAGTRISGNHSNHEGGSAIFYVSNDRTGDVAIRDSVLRNNTGDGFSTYPGIFFLGHHISFVRSTVQYALCEGSETTRSLFSVPSDNAGHIRIVGRASGATLLRGGSGSDGVFAFPLARDAGSGGGHSAGPHAPAEHDTRPGSR